MKKLTHRLAVSALALFILGFSACSTPAEGPAMTGEELEEAVGVYLRANVADITPVDPVLGGAWYLIDYSIDEETQSIQVLTEDGHIQEEFSVNYRFKPNGDLVIEEKAQ